MKKIVFLTLILALAGCASTPKERPLYSWGSYQEQTYLMYNKPDKATPAMQILKLEAEVEKSKAKGLAVPPGLYAHLGWLNMQQNNIDKAHQYFQLERQVYPESTVLMDRFLNKLNNKPEGQL